MPILANQIRQRAHVYVAHGGKKNRRQQVDRLELFVNWVEAAFGLTGLEQIGKRHVIAFWKADRRKAKPMADPTAHGYWLALRVLWDWLGRVELPPEPWANKSKSDTVNDEVCDQDGS